MRHLINLFLVALLAFPGLSSAQNDDDIFEANRLKKVFPDDRVAATLIEEDYSFDRGKSEDKLPVVTAMQNTGINFLALRERAGIQYYDFYNSFTRITSFKQLEKMKGMFGMKKNYNVGYAIDRSASSSEFFSDDSRVKFFNIGFTGYGDVTRVETEKKYLDSKYLTSVYFHTWFPAKEKIVRFKVPDWLQLDIREFNFDGYKITKQKTQEKGYTVYTYKLQNLVALKNEKRAIGAAHQWPHLMLVVKSFNYDGKDEKGFGSVADLYSWYNYLYKKSVNKPEDLKAKVDELIKGKTTPVDKTKAIFYWVQDNIRYIAFEDGLAGFIPATAQDVFKSKYGDCKGMANLTTEMLKLAGLEAYMTWIGTRHLPYDYSLPSLAVDNHCISTVIMGGKEYFLDATEKYVPFGDYAWRIQGKEVLIGKGDKYDVKKVPLQEIDKSKILTQTSFQLKDNVLKGHVKVTLTGEQRTSFHQYYHDLPSDDKKKTIQKFLEFGNKNLTVSNVKTSDLGNREIPVVFEGDIDLSNYVITEDKEIYAGIDFFPEDLSGYIPDKDRQRDYELHSSYVSQDETELVLPAGYKVASVPAAINEKYPDYEVSGSYTIKDNKVTFKKVFSLNSGRIRKTDFDNWKAFTKKLKDFNSSMILIKKP
ncbi:MAG TPA: transglutaminase domain-containing protein [Chitinophagaceae bacterium]|jgi:transglutaminase-like putative cysteine protease|nr:transglutaminase domain-containing protein [Chitinophagaceae bacterium]HMU56994.1 transglutaminase domain-containing protein [Chitinophagaceae bacterium]